MKFHKIDNAIILAAGWGSRLLPATKNTPKPLIKIKGIPIIETQIMALHEQGIKKIYIVIGRMPSKFSYLKRKYSVDLIINDEWETSNVFVSLWKASKYLSNTIILEGDTLINNSSIIMNKISYSSIGGVSFQKEQCEYVLNFDTEDNVTGYSLAKNIKKGIYIVNIYHLLKKDALLYKEKLSEFINIDRYRNSYAEKALFMSNAKIKVQLLKSIDAIEIDSYDELKAIDNSYSV